ncbi:MAG: hypothetical protein U9N61_04900 [Euryarchaeota archaeon]|nr:hypothetical protein [Euryarchaeota archaeon]
MENKFLFNDSIIVRFISLFVIGAILFTVVWYLSYHFLPEGLLRGKTGAAIIIGSDAAPTMLEGWGTIVLYNLVALFVIVLINFIRYRDRFPLGYITPLGLIAMYAVFLGTNSFSIHGRAGGTNISSIVARRALRDDRVYTCGSCNVQPVPHCTNRRHPPYQSGSAYVVRTMGWSWACDCIDYSGGMA